jgi:hypothetical protein
MREKDSHDLSRARPTRGVERLTTLTIPKWTSTRDEKSQSQIGQDVDTDILFPFLVQELQLEGGQAREYRIQKILGEGRSAIVFEAVLLGSKYNRRQVALKCPKQTREEVSLLTEH